MLAETMARVSTRRVRLLCTTALAAYSLVPVMAYGQSLPQGGVVTGGSATISSNGTNMNITTTTSRTAIKWDSFSIGGNNRVEIIQPSRDSITLNRVTGSSPSQIAGTLKSNGRVVVSNPNGVWFGPDAHVDVASIMATTGKITDASASAFAAGGSLKVDAAPAKSAVVNEGSITVSEGGMAALVAPGVRNSGTITARVGSVKLASGTKATVDFYGDGLINLAVEGQVAETAIGPGGAQMKSAVENSGKIVAEGGHVTLSANAAKGVLEQVVNMSGVIEAKGVSTKGGVVELLAGDGSMAVAGSIDASGVSGKNGGKIRLQAGNSAATEDGVLELKGSLNASSSGGQGGEVAIDSRFLFQTGNVKADGATGGKITVAAGAVTQSGTLSAEGTSGPGGSITVTTKHNIIQTANAVTSTKSVSGSGGSVTLTAGTRAFSSGKLRATGDHGGTVSILGSDVALAGASVDASGTTGGGTIVVGGGVHGAGAIVSKTATVTHSTTLAADATVNGKGGTISVWGTDETIYQGTASARGGSAGGNGGFIEVSSKGTLTVTGTGDAGAPKGTAGTMLIDPKNIIIDSSAGGIGQYDLIDPNSGSGTLFGNLVVELGNGTVLVTKPNDTVGGVLNAGSVYFYEGSTGRLLGALQGSHANDKVGSTSTSSTVALTFLDYSTWSSTPRTNNTSAAFLINSPNWYGNRGAVTWVAANSYVNAVVSSSNSLVGSSANDYVGSSAGTTRIHVLPTYNNYLVFSPGWAGGKGAVTFGTAAAGITGEVSAANSLVGTRADTSWIGDRVGNGITSTATANGTSSLFKLSNGNFLITSPDWNGQAGALTFGNAQTGIPVGEVSSSNSLVGARAGTQYSYTYGGSTTYAYYGGDQIVVSSPNTYLTALSTGDYVLRAPNWDHGKGAVVIGSGTTGITGTVTTANALVGTIAGYGDTSDGTYTYYTSTYGYRAYFGGDAVGSGSLTELTSGAIVIASPNWSTNKGAVTWLAAGTTALGTGGSLAAVSGANSFIGATSGSASGYDGNHTNSIINGDQVGTITALANGNYVIAATNWSGKKGGVALMNGATGRAIIGSSGSTGDTMSASNSLVGSSTDDFVGSTVKVLTGTSNFVTASASWSSGKGAVTYIDGATGLVGTVSASNSLVGSQSYQNVTFSVGGDNVGSTITVLANGGWVINSPNWSTGKGAVTFVAPGAAAPTGTINSSNSLVGTTSGVIYTNVCTAGDTYCVSSTMLFGGDQLGNDGIVTLSNNKFLIRSSLWSSARGAMTFVNGATGAMVDGTTSLSGNVSSANSLVGDTAGTSLVDDYDTKYYRGGDRIGAINSGSLVTELDNGNFVIRSRYWHSQTGAITFGNATTGVAGVVSSSNSLVGSTAASILTPADAGLANQSTLSGGDEVGSNAVVMLTNSNYLLVSPNWNSKRGAVAFGSGTSGVTGVISSSNSLVGSTANDQVGSASGSTTIRLMNDGSYVIGSSNFNGNRGAITVGQANTALTGTITASNSMLGSTAADAVGVGITVNSATAVPPTGIINMADGTYVIAAPSWSGKKGAILWSGLGLTGTVSTSNAVTGNVASGTAAVRLFTLSNDPTTFLAALPNEGSGRVVIGMTSASGMTYSRAQVNTVKLSPTLITRALNSGTSLVFQANNDITINSSIIADAASTSSLTFNAGRSFTIASGVTIDSGNGNITILANDSVANGVVDAQRDSGSASVSLAATSTLSAGTGAISITLASSTDKTNNGAGDISLGALSGSSVTVKNQGSASGALNVRGTITASGTGTSILLVTGGVFANTAGASALAAANGRWLAYSADPRNNTKGGLTSTGKYYNQTFTANGPGTQPTTGNYFIYSVQPTVSVTASGTVGYGQALGALSPSITGFIDGDDAASALTGTASFSSAYVAGDAVGGSYPVTVSAGTLASPMGYALSYSNGSITVVPQTLTVTLTGTISKTYDGSVTAALASGNYVISGLYNTDSIAVTKTSGTYGSANAGTGINVSASLVTGDFTAGGSTNLSNYVLPTGTVSGTVGTITAKTLTASLTGTASKTYDGTTTATLASGNFSLSGLISGESITVTKTTGTYGQSNVGSGLGVSTNLATGDFTAGSGTSLSNYVLPTGNVSGTIGSVTAKTLTVGLTGSVSKTYDGTNTATLASGNYSITGLVSGESITVTQTAGTYGQTAKGTNLSVSTTLAAGDFTAGSGTSLSNYVLPTGAVSGNVGAITGPLLSVILVGSTTKVYDGTHTASLVSANFQISGLLNGDVITVTKTAGTFGSVNVGSGISVSTTLSASDFAAAGAADLSNYSLPTSASGLIGTITAKTLTASLTGSASKTYDGATAAALSVANYALSGLISGESITVTKTTGTYGSANAGSGINVTSSLSSSDFTAGAGTLLSNYVLPTTASGTVGTIAAKALTVALTGSASKTYDGTAAATLSAANYAISGLISGESITVSKTSGTYGGVNAGSSISVSTSLASGDFSAGSGTLLSNYTLPTGTASGTIGTITAKSLTASLTGTASKTYDGTTAATLSAANYALSGLISGESIAVTKTTGTYGSANAGSAINVTSSLGGSDFTAGTGTLLSNYVLPTTASGTIGGITPKALTASLTGTTSKAYDGTTAATLSAVHYTLSGLISGESITVTETTGTYASRNVGSGINVTAALDSGDLSAGTGTLLSNYTLPTTASGTIGSISAKVLTVALTGTASKTYDGTTAATLSAANYAISGLASGESMTVSRTSGTYGSANAGSSINVSASLTSGDFSAGAGTLLSNYSLPTGTASGTIGTISPKALTGTLTGSVSKTYDGNSNATLSAANFSFVGLVGSDAISVTKTTGTMGGVNAGSGLSVSTTLADSDFATSGGTMLSNYILPTSVSGTVGSVTPRALTVTLVGPLTKVSDGSAAANLASTNFVVEGLAAGESITVKPTSGTYGSTSAGSNLPVSATLTLGSYLAEAGTSLDNYALFLGEVTANIGTLNSAPTVVPIAQLITPKLTPPSAVAPITPPGGGVIFGAGQSTAFIPQPRSSTVTPAGSFGTGVAGVSGGPSAAGPTIGAGASANAGGAGGVAGGQAANNPGSGGSNAGGASNAPANENGGGNGGGGQQNAVAANSGRSGSQQGGNGPQDSGASSLLGARSGTQNVHDYANSYLSSIALGATN